MSAPETSNKAVGKAVPHLSAVLHVTGKANFTDDLCKRYRGLLHAWPVQVHEAHATVLSIDASAALERPGVVTVLSAQDVPGLNNMGVVVKDEPLFPEEIQFSGQAVAWVLAEDLESAKLGAQDVRVQTRTLPAIIGLQAAEEAASYLLEPARIERGEVDEEMARAPHRLKGELFVGGQEHFYLEAQCAIAEVDGDNGISVYSSTQHPSETQAMVARVLKLPKSQVVVQSLRMGGAFGGKESQANAWAAIAAIGVAKTGKPVSLRLDRARDMQMTGKRHPFLGRYEVGFDDDGKILAFDLSLLADGGYSVDLSGPILQRALFHADNAYLVPNLRVEGRIAKTNTCSHTAFRGFGGPQGMAMIEDAIDAIARTLKRPPHEIRQLNLYREGQQTHYGQEVGQAERLTRIFAQLSDDAQFESRWREMEAFNSSHRESKRGLALTPVKFGISFTAKFFNQAGALVLIYRDGSVQVNHGGTEMGQGLHTKMAQVAATTLGVDLESIRIMPTQTDKVPNTSPTAASSGSDLNGAAVDDACLKLKSRLAQVAAERFGCDSTELTFEAGRIYQTDGAGPVLSFTEVVEWAYFERVSLSATGFYKTPDLHFDAEEGRGKPFHYFTFGAAISEVEVDAFTGAYKILRVDILQDAGNSLSPLIDIGQIEGGFMQGLGWLTQEELVWSDEGRLLTQNASTYKLPSLSELPETLNVKLLERAEEPGVIYGSKAVGEPPFMLALSVREALRQAIAAFGASGQVVKLESPATPEQVYWSIQRVQRG